MCGNVNLFLLSILGPSLITTSRALDFFREHGDGNVSQLAESLGCSKRSAERMVAELKEKGILSRRGSARAGIWIVCE